MTPSPYHDEWRDLGADSLTDRLAIIEDVLARSKKPCKERDSNVGICRVLRDVKRHIREGTQPPQAHSKMLGETAYVFWLMNTRELQHRSLLDSRIDQMFKGTSYYEPDAPDEAWSAGFRQFEFELFAFARLIEEGIDFDDLDAAGEGLPDIRVHYDGLSFPLEVKMPFSGLESKISDAKRKIFTVDRAPQGAVVFGLDYAMQGDLHAYDHFNALCDRIRDAIGGSALAVYAEYSQHAAEGAPGDVVQGGAQTDPRISEALYLMATGETHPEQEDLGPEEAGDAAQQGSAAPE